MALNEIFKDADSLSYPVAGTVKSGDLVAVGGVIGVAETDAREARDVSGGYVATLRHVGVFEFESKDAGAVSVGDIVYGVPADLAAGTKEVTVDDDSGTNVPVGVVYRGKAAGAGPVYVRINN